MTSLTTFGLELLDTGLDRDAVAVEDITLTNREDSTVFATGERFDSLPLQRHTPIGVSRLDRTGRYAGVGGGHQLAQDGLSIRVEGLHRDRGGGVPDADAFRDLLNAIEDVFNAERDDPPEFFHALEAPDRQRRNTDARDYYRVDIEIPARGYRET